MIFSYDGIVDSIEKRLSLLSNWRRVLFHSVYKRLIEAVAYAMDKMVYLTEFLYRESNWTTALKRRSLLLKAKFLSYTPHRKIAPSGNLIVTADSTGFFNNYTYSGERVTLNRWDTFTNTNGDTIVFCTENTNYSTGAKTVSETLAAGSVIDEGSGQVSFLMSDTSNVSAGDIVKISGTSNYDGYHTIDSVTTNTKITVTTTYDAETMDGTELIISGFTFVPVKQGTPKTYTYTANGDTNETITIYSDSIDNDEFEVFEVDSAGTILSTVSIIGVDTTETEHYFLSDTDNYYVKIENDYDFEAVNLIFGDDIYTKKLVAGTKILVKYAITDGDDGNISASSTISTFSEDPVDSAGNTATLYITNDEEIGDGDDIESVTSIRNNAPNLFTAGYRCGSYNDWLTVLENDSRIYSATIWTTEDVADDTVTTNQNKVYVAAISSDGTELTETQKSNIVSDYLKNLKSPTEIVSWQDLNIVYLFVKVNATINNVSKASIKTSVYEDLDTEYGILNTSFQTEVKKSNWESIVDDISDIIYHTSELYNCERLDGTAKANYQILPYNSNASTASEEINLVADTLELWRQNYSSNIWQQDIERIGYDSGGSWVAETGYEITLGNINYTTSQVTFNISSGLADAGTLGTDYRIYMSYKTEDGNSSSSSQQEIRFPAEKNYITDVDSALIRITDENGISTLTYESSS